MNTRINYLYRDASNWKSWGDVIFPGRMTKSLYARLQAALSEEKYFIASQVGIPEVFLWDENAEYDRDNPPSNLKAGDYMLSVDDHCWHEFSDYELVEFKPNDSRTIQQFVEACEAAAESGWEDFDPNLRKYS
jgi:hypothetical protein